MSDTILDDEKETASLEPEPVPNNDDSIPNGGLVAWLQVAGAFFLTFNTSGIVNSYGLFQTYFEGGPLAQESPSKIAWIGSVQGCLVLFIGGLTGPLFDRGYFRPMLIIGTFMVTLALMMLSICKTYWQIMLGQSLCFGIGGGCLFVPGMAITSTYFSTRRAAAIGVVASGSSVGAVVYSTLFRHLVAEVGFAWTCRIYGFIILGTLLFSIAVMRTRIEPVHHRSLIAKQALREPTFLVFLAGIFLGYMGAYIPFYHVTAYAIGRTGASESLSFYLIAVINGCSAFGRLIPGILADKFGPFNMLIPLAFMSAILAFGWMGIESVPGICIFSVLYGFATGGYVSLPTTCVAGLTKDLHEVGARVGMSFLFAGLGMLVGNPIAGALVDLETNSFWKAQLCCAMLIIASTFCFLLARLSITKEFWAKA